MIEGPIQTNSSDLVFYFDSKEPKSYVGEPTTNLNQQVSNYTGTGYSSDGEWTSDPTRFTKTYDASIVTPIGFGATLCAESGTAGYHHLSRMGGSGESGAHSISCYIKPLNSITDFTIGMLGDGSNQISFNLSTRAITYGGGISNRNAFCTEVKGFPGWLYVGANIEGRSGGWVGCLGISTASSYTPTTPYKAFYITGLQYEYKVAPTKFTIGTRSNTQGLLDLIGGSTVDLTNASFDSSSNILFASNKVITATMTNLRPTSGITQECWFSTTSNIAQVFIGAQYGSSSNNSYALWIDGANSLAAGVNIGGSFNYSTQAYTITTNQYYHFIHTYNGSTQAMYMNGVLVKSWATSGAITYDAANNTLLAIGNDWNSGYNGGPNIGVIGYLPVVRIYNRALSASEILKNFNSQRSRYNV